MSSSASISLRAELTHVLRPRRFNCQMGRGRTTTGMIASSIIASILSTSDPSTIAGDSTDGSALSDMTVSTNSDSDLNEERAFRSGKSLAPDFDAME